MKLRPTGPSPSRNRIDAMNPILPAAETVEEYESLPRDPEPYLPAVEVVRGRHGLASGPVVKFTNGSTPIFSVGEEHVVKLFAPIYALETVTERAFLEFLHGRLPLPTPGFIAEGELEGWRYIVMERLPGEELRTVWNDLDRAERLHLTRLLGEATAALHTLDPAPLPIDGAAWHAFIEAQRNGCVERQRRLGLGEAWLQMIPAFLDGVKVDDSAPVVPLHTEIMPDHVLVRREQGEWKLTGMIDFEPSTVGVAEYDLASVGLFHARGDGEILRDFLLAYGYPESALNVELGRRIMLYTLLHRYSSMPWYMRFMPADDAATTLEGLADLWFDPRLPVAR